MLRQPGEVGAVQPAPVPGVFSYEGELHDHLVPHLRTFLRDGSPYVVAHELRVGGGVVDMVVAVPDTDILRLRLKGAARRLSGPEILILTAARSNSSLQVDAVARATHLGAEQVERAVCDLLDDGLVLVSAGNRLVCNEMARPWTRVLVSIEVKLAKWRIALRQAARNLLFSSASYVVLDAERCGPALTHRHLFEQAGVGLATVAAGDVSLELAWPARGSRSLSQIYWWEASEAVLDRILDRTVAVSPELASWMWT